MGSRAVAREGKDSHLMSLFTKLFGTYSQRQLKKLEEVADYIDRLGEKYAAMSNEELRKALLENALEELEAFKAKYRSLSELAAVFEAMDNISQENIA